MQLQLILCALVVIAAAQPQCDPLTQYEKNGECCKMCGPGTHMTSIGTCLEPQCNNCPEREYQEKYTRELKCQRQPYCDPNKNFEDSVHSTKKQNVCVCKPGYHCSSEECITCVPHHKCKPGQEARPKGSHTNNTVCRECPPDTFSIETSWDSVCVKWTECENGFHIQQSGTDVSDNICEQNSRAHVVAIAIVVSLVVSFVIVILGVYLWRVKHGDAQGKLKGCVESCFGDAKEPTPRGAALLVTNPTELNDEELISPEFHPSQEEHLSTMEPEENEIDPSEEMSSDLALTERGNFVTQENGKSEILSRQESQPDSTFTMSST